MSKAEKGKKAPENWEIDHVTLKERLARVPCPYRLFPARIRALETLTERKVLLEIQRNITTKIARQFGMVWAQQFVQDFEVYGLYEAILYFHDIPDVNKDTALISNICDLYDEIALLYMNHHLSIEDSDDPSIQLHLDSIRRLGGNSQAMNPLSMAPLPQPDIIPPPLSPAVDPHYERQLPIHERLQAELYDFWGDSTGPGNLRNFADELIEQLGSRFRYEGFPGLQLIFFEVAHFLLSYEIDLYSSTGQYIISSIIKDLEGGLYGSYDSEVSCIQCKLMFEPKVSLNAVNSCLASGGWLCEHCQDKL